MIIISGQTYSTIIDAAGELGVSAKTVREYIAKSIIPEPPVIQFGIRTVKHFPPDYMKLARNHLEKPPDCRSAGRRQGRLYRPKRPAKAPGG